MRTYLRDVIGIADSNVGHVNDRRIAVQDEGLQVIDDFIEFDDDGIATLCQSVRKPGGTIPDPTNAARQIPNPGFSIPAISEKRLKSAAYLARYYHMIGRGITHDSMSRSRLRLMEQHRQLIDDHEDPEKLPEVSRAFGIVKAMDLVPGHLRERLGVRKVSLSYVIRENVAPAALEPQVVDQLHGANFTDFNDELINTTPHAGPGYLEDNAKIYQILQDMVNGTSFESSLKAHQRNRNGREAYLALCQHNLGTSKWERIVENAETYLMKREWNGKNHRFTLRSHISKHRESHNDLRRASEFIPYDVPNERLRVTRLLKSITSKDPNIIAAMTHVQGTPAQREDFETAVDFILLTAPNNGNAPQREHRISGLNQRGHQQKSGVGPKTGVELRYHNKREYSKLSPDKKKELAEWRKRTKRNNTENDKGNNDDPRDSKISALESTIKALEAKVASLASNKEKPEPKPALRNPLTQRT